jgi:hypothetical protein
MEPSDRNYMDGRGDNIFEAMKMTENVSAGGLGGSRGIGITYCSFFNDLLGTSTLHRVTLTLALIAGNGCSDVSSTTGTSKADWEEVLRAPREVITTLGASPDGAVFAASELGLYRHIPRQGDDWTRVAVPADVPLELFAASMDVVFAIARLSGSVHRWDEVGGWNVHRTVLSDSIIQDGDQRMSPMLFGIWGRSASDVYAAGDEGNILHYDGHGWRVKPKPLATPGSGARETSPRIWGIAGNRERTYAVMGGVLEERAGQWRYLRVPPEVGGSNFHAVAAAGNDVIFVGTQFTERGDRSRLVRLSSRGKWETLDTPELWGLMDGESQTDGSALFWSRSDVLVEVSNGRLRLHQLPHIGRMVGAARIGEFLFVAGYTTLAESTESVVLRAKPPVLN